MTKHGAWATVKALRCYSGGARGAGPPVRAARAIIDLKRLVFSEYLSAGMDRAKIRMSPPFEMINARRYLSIGRRRFWLAFTKPIEEAGCPMTSSFG